MEIETRVIGLFKDIPEIVTRKAVMAEGVPREAKTLEYNMNQYMRRKYKKEDRKSFIKTDNSSTCIDTFIENEIITNKQKHRSWNSLNTCDKWSLIKAYFSSNPTSDIVFDEKVLKKQLLSNKLDVKYDKDAHIIISIT